MKTYPKYKESGIPWIGQIPEGWGTSYLLHALRGNITDGPHETPRLVEDGIPFISVDSLNDSEHIDFTIVKKYISEEDYLEYCKKAILEENDILFSKSATIGKTAIVGRERFMVWSPLAIIKPAFNKVYPKYLYYVVSNEQYRKSVCLLATYNTQLNVGMRTLEKSLIPIPPLAEQEAIAAFLDKKTGNIDELVGLLNKQIADVRAYRQSLITETVTQGLNKDVPMKDSGVEWIGQIPEGWHLTKLKHLTSKIGSGITPSGGATIYQDSGVLFIRSQNVYANGLKLDDVAYISDEIDNSMQSSRVLYGDVLLNITGASIGRCTTFNLERTRANVNQHVCIIRPITELLLSKYLQYTLNSSLGQTQIALCQTGGNREGLNFEQLKNFLIPDIPLFEQQQIVEFLDKKTKDIDELLVKLEAQVADLLAYKSSLISEAVTGKIYIEPQDDNTTVTALS